MSKRNYRLDLFSGATRKEFKAAGAEVSGFRESRWNTVQRSNLVTISSAIFTDFPKLKSELPLQFDEATNRTIELIDVPWFKGNAIVAAFEVESTISIYSGLLRMSDLVSMQPHLTIPLYVKKPECPARKSGDQWPKGLFL